MRAILRALPSMLLLCTAANAYGQHDASLTQEQAMALAAQHAPEVLVGLADAAAAHADEDVAGMLPNPQIGAGVSPSYAFIATLSMRLPIFGQRSSAARAALAQARVADASVDVVLLDAGLSASLAWIDLWQAMRERGLAAQDVARLTGVLATAEARVSEGSAPELEKLRAETQAFRAQARAGALLAAQEAAQARLGRLLGGMEDGASPLALGEPEAGPLPSEAAMDARLISHPRMRQQTAAIHSADAALRSEERARWPEPGLSVQDWASRKAGTHDIRVLATLDVPLFDGPRVDRAEAQVDAVKARERAVRMQLSSAAVAARADYLSTRRLCEMLETRVVPVAREAAKRAEQAYADGALDLMATQLSSQARSDAEQELLACSAGRARAWARLQHALGGNRVE